MPVCACAETATNVFTSCLVHGAIERVGGGYRADEDQHDEPHAFLAVVAAVEEAHAAAGQDQQAANPQGRRLVALGFLVKRRDFDGRLEYGQQQAGRAEADQRRNEQGLADLGRLAQSTPLVPEGLAAIN